MLIYGFGWSLHEISRQEYNRISSVHSGSLNTKTNTYKTQKIENLFSFLSQEPNFTEKKIKNNFLHYSFHIENKTYSISVPLIRNEICFLNVFGENGTWLHESPDKAPKDIKKLFKQVQLLFQDYVNDTYGLRNEITEGLNK